MTSDPDTLPSGRPAGILIVTAAVVSVAFMAHHPHGHGHTPAEFFASTVHGATLNGVVHGTLIACMAAFVGGFSVFTARLGPHSLMARLGFVAYALGAFVASLAALTGGFVVPAIAQHYVGRSEADQAVAMTVVSAFGLAQHVAAQAWVLATSVALVAWSVDLLGRARLTGALGLAVGGASAAALLSGHLPMNVHGVLGFVVGQALWSLAVATLLIRGRV
ncbi:MAG: hypothetical protein U0746_15100 [Gemmataceae bacterium]